MNYKTWPLFASQNHPKNAKVINETCIFPAFFNLLKRDYYLKGKAEFVQSVSNVFEY